MSGKTMSRSLLIVSMCVLVGKSSAQNPEIPGVVVQNPVVLDGDAMPLPLPVGPPAGVAGILNNQMNVGANIVEVPPALAAELTTLGSLAIAQASGDQNSGEEASDSEVVCQTVKEALLALKTVTVGQLDMQADTLPEVGRKMLQAANVAASVASASVAPACPGEMSEMQYGNCLNYFFTPECSTSNEGMVNNLFGRSSPLTSKTLEDVRGLVLHMFKNTPVCNQVEDGFQERSCGGGMEKLKPVNYAQFMANAIAKIEQQQSPTVIGANKQVSELAKAFTHLHSAADTVDVGGGPSVEEAMEEINQEAENKKEEEEQASATGAAVPMFLALLCVALGGIGLVVFCLRNQEMVSKLNHMETASAVYASLMSKVTEASQAAFGTSSSDTLSKRKSKPALHLYNHAQDSKKPKPPTLQEKLSMLREANSTGSMDRKKLDNVM